MDEEHYGKAPRNKQPATGRVTPYDPSRDRANTQGLETEEDALFDTPAHAFKVGCVSVSCLAQLDMLKSISKVGKSNAFRFGIVCFSNVVRTA